MSESGPLSLANQINLRAIDQAVGGHVKVTASQNRHMDEESPDWVLRIDGKVHGVDFAVENDGPALSQLIDDAVKVLGSLGVDVFAEIDKITKK